MAEFKVPAPRQQREGNSAEADMLYAPASWECYFDDRKFASGDGRYVRYFVAGEHLDSPVVFVLLHGGGLNALSWSCVSSHLKKMAPVVAPDFRAHGDTTCDNDDLASETLCEDTVWLLSQIYGDRVPAIVLIGHSLGGAIATRLAAGGQVPVVGLVVIDVVEGTALASYPTLEAYLRTRPQEFASVERAIQWSVESNTIRNLASARVSVPNSLTQPHKDMPWEWRTDLSVAEQYWDGWFVGISSLFLSVPARKLLLLAGTDRLDTELIIGQMQGKYQVKFFPESGHHVHEDIPKKTAKAVEAFLVRQLPQFFNRPEA